jgi:hypothetical protein
MIPRHRTLSAVLGVWLGVACGTSTTPRTTGSGGQASASGGAATAGNGGAVGTSTLDGSASGAGGGRDERGVGGASASTGGAAGGSAGGSSSGGPTANARFRSRPFGRRRHAVFTRVDDGAYGWLYSEEKPLGVNGKELYGSGATWTVEAGRDLYFEATVSESQLRILCSLSAL